jgi:transposase
VVRETPEERAERARVALGHYNQPLTIRQVAEKMDISYGTAYSLIAEAGGGPKVFRARGTRLTRLEDSGHTIDE